MSVTGSIMAGVGLAGSLGGAAIGSNAATTAAGDQEQAANNAANLQYKESQNALQFQEQEYGQNQANEAPWLQSGAEGLGNLDYLLGLGQPTSTAPMTGSPGAFTGQVSQPASVGSGAAVQPQNRLANSLSNGSIQGPSGSIPAAAQGPSGAIPGTPSPGTGMGVNPTPMAQGQSGAVAGPAGSIAAPNSAAIAGTQGVQGSPGVSTQSAPYTLGGGAAAGGNTPTASPILSQGPGAALPAGVTPNGPAAGPSGSLPASPSSPAGASTPGSAASGGFGSLLAPYSGTFTAPTAAQALASPGEQAQMQLGEQALQQSAAAQGNLLTGGTAQALDAYGQNLASTNYQNTYNNAYNTYATNYNQYEQQQTNEYNRLASLAGMGQTAAQNLGTLGQSASNNVTSNLLGTGQQIGQDYQNAAAANASGVVGSANAWSSGLGGATSGINNLLLLNQLGGANTTVNDTGMTTGEGG